MIVSAIKPYSYKNLTVMNNKQVSDSANFPVSTQNGANFTPVTGISFKGNTQNWTNGILEGYDAQINQLQSILAEPIKDNLTAAAPIVIVYSPDKDVAQMVKQSVRRFEPSTVNKLEPDSASFFKIVNNALVKGRDIFNKANIKSILMVDNIEQYINASDKEIERLKKDFKDVFTENDFENIRKYGNNSDNINLLKSVADYCSKVPKRENDISSATTIFSVSENPQIIDSELLRRPEKVYTIVFPPLYGRAFAKVLKDEVIKQDNFIKNIRYVSRKEIEKIDMPYNSWRNLQDIKNKRKENTLNLNPDKIPFDVIAEFCSPDDKYGAFLAKQIPEIVQQALYKYIANPEIEFLPYLLKELKNTKRDLTPKTLDHEEKIRKFVEFKADNNYIKDVVQVDKMLKAYKAGLVSKKKINKLISDIVNSEIETIKSGNPVEDTFSELKYKPALDELKSKYIISRIDKLSENRYKFSYQDGKTDYADLYLGSFGWGKETLWVDSSDIKKVELTRHFINEIKSLDEFKKVKVIEFPADEKPEGELYKPTGRITIDKKPIYSITLEDKNESK